MPLTPTQKGKFRESQVAYCAAAVANEPKIHYSQMRPFPFVDRIDVGWHTLDCSGFVINSFWNGMHDLAVYAADPSGQKYSGYGNTWTMEAWLRLYGKNVTKQTTYWVGDIAMFNGHTMVCSRNGNAQTSAWTSHGSEGGPSLRTLHYRNDLVGVWRHPALL